VKPSRRRLVFLSLTVAALAALRVVLWRPLTVTGTAPDDGYVRVPGIVHVHTTLSDGGGPPEEVMAAARAAGLKFVAVTDHNNLDAKPFEGYKDGVLLVVGTEASTTRGHVVGLGIPDPAFRFSGDARDALEDIRDLGGVSFAAHPTSPRADFQWSGWDEPGPWGIELLNGDSQWRSAGWWRLALTAALYGLNHRYALLGSLTSPDETLRRWDALLGERDVPGIAGADAHSRVPIRKEKSVRFPSYEALFALARNYVVLEAPLTGRAEADTAAIVSAFARGRAYVGVDALAPADGFSFVAEASGKRWTMGDTVPVLPGLTLRAGGRMPASASVRLLRDGKTIAERAGAVVQENVGPGVYRVEVRVPGWPIPWILSNPIVVADEATTQRRRARAAWPTEPPVPAAVQVLDAFEGRTAFEPASDRASTLDKNVIDAKGGGDGRGAARLAFHLAPPDAGNRDVYCALVDRTPRDLTGRTGLTFRIKGDGVYRLWVQVRDANPASADEGTEWWFASVRTSPEWRTVAVPFARLRSINPKTDGRLDLDKVKALVFVLDRGADKPGTAGTIWLDDLATY
jgi:hypothetical protein